MQITIDGSRAAEQKNLRYRGQGMISCNGSSRLLLDYKEKAPERYWQILRCLYGVHGLRFTHFKVELGADVNTSSGTEPTTMRYAQEPCDVTRGAGFQIAADVKAINPDVTLDMLWWSEPRWVTDAADVYAARYRWYKETLDAAYKTYGLRFDYVSANRNERAVDAAWILYLSHALKAERDCPYDYARIKIVAADECGTWNIAREMTENPALCDAVDVIGSHYTSYAEDCVKRLAAEKGKEVWFSEGSAPMNHAPSTCRFDEGHTGLSGINGVLDIATRMLTMVSGGYMTLYEYQPAVAAYYDGVTYCQKQLITANTPWNGYFSLDSGYFMSLHFSQFIGKGWRYIFDACHADGKPGGDGHAIVDAQHTYVTACSDNGDFSTVITNTTAAPITYNFAVCNLAKANGTVYIWETRGPENGQKYDANYFKRVGAVTPENGAFSVTVQPFSIVTVSTLDVPERVDSAPDEAENTILPLPYADDFQYAEDFLSARGGAPLFTTDEGGAFEVAAVGGVQMLMQQITRENKADEWGGTPEPVTNFGDDRWYNYRVSAELRLGGTESYAGVGLRFILADSGRSGYSLLLHADGTWQLLGGNAVLQSGQLAGFDANAWHSVQLAACYDDVTAAIDGVTVLQYHADGAGYSAGRAALYSSYDRCCFKHVQITATGAAAYVQTLDDCDAAFAYSGDGWTHVTMDSFKHYRRTVSKGTAGASAEIAFDGTGILLTGAQEGCVISAVLDGEAIDTARTVPAMAHRQTFLSLHGLARGRHTLQITVQSGVCAVDAAQIITD